MKQRFPPNPNLHMSYYTTFKNMKVQVEHLPMIDEYLNDLYNTMEGAVGDYSRVLALRVDPVIPAEINDMMTLEDHKGLTSKFIQSLKSIIKHDRERKRQSGWVPDTKVRYVWCREFGTNGKPHYHFFLLLNRDAYHLPGRASSPNENLCNRISRAWYSALGVEWDPQYPWIHIPQNPVYWIDRDDANSFQDAFHRASYLCKTATKQYGIGLRAFDTSHS